MHSEKFIKFTNPFVKSIVAALAVSIVSNPQDHPHLHQDSSVLPDGAYGAQAVVTGTSSSHGTGTAGELRRGIP